MAFHRKTLEFADTGTTQKDAGAVFGELLQLRWSATTDTGASLAVALFPGDTGDSISLWNDTGKLDDSYVAAIRNNPNTALAPNEADTGYAPFVAAGDRLKATVTAKGTTAVSGKLYVYFRDDA